MAQLQSAAVRQRVSDRPNGSAGRARAAYRLLRHYGWTHLITTTSRLRVPGTEDQFASATPTAVYEQSLRRAWSKIDVDGNVLDGCPTRDRAGFVIHSRIHMAAGPASIIHTHTSARRCPRSTAGCSRQPKVPCSTTSASATRSKRGERSRRARAASSPISRAHSAS